jgi:RNA polymerase sigma factor (sigma-70 family)
MRDVVQQLGQAAFALNADEWTDARLLECFLNTHDHTAFEVLVRRHGPMVLGVCSRILGNPQDAEDAFQATFLVLVRKAASIVPRGMVGNWLYGVAYQTAIKARAMAERRAAKERQVMDAPEPAAPQPEDDEALWRELRPIIDEELSRLPTKYRAPLVLCDIEMKSYKEAAEELGWPEGTVAGRLSRARTMLAERLKRRGVVLTAVAIPMLLTHNAMASVPAALTIPTLEAATLVAAGQATSGAVSANVVALTEGVVKAMMLTKIKLAMAVCVGVCLAGLGVGTGYGFLPASATAQDQKKVVPQPGQPPANKAAPNNGNGGLGGLKLGNANNQNGKNNKNGNGKNEPNGNNGQNGNNQQNGNNNQQGNNEKNGNNNQQGNNEQNGNNNQQGNNEQNGNNNQNGNNQKNGNNGQNGNNQNGNNLKNGNNNQKGALGAMKVNANNQNGNNLKNGNNNQNGNAPKKPNG